MNKGFLLNSLTRNGIKNFIWPIKRNFIEKVNHKVMTDFTKLSSESEELHSTLPIIQKWLIPEILKIIEAIKLKPYVMKKNLFISIDNYTILKKILDNKLSDYLPNFLSKFSTVPENMKIPFFIKMLIRTVENNNINQLINLERSNDYFLEPNSLTLENARIKKKLLIYNNVQKILNRNSNVKDHIKLNQKSLNKLSDVIITNICDELRLSSETIDYQIIKYIKNLTSELIKVTIKNVQAVEQEKIRGDLWVGSSGASYFIKLICHTLRRNNKKIIGHSHGSGYSIVHLCHTFHAVDLNTCDEFCTEKKVNLDDLQSEINENYLYGMNKPKIKSVKKSNNQFKTYFYKKKSKELCIFQLLINQID